MPTWLLFLGPTLIWASTWHVILYQLGEVPVLNSIGMLDFAGNVTMLVLAIALISKKLKLTSLICKNSSDMCNTILNKLSIALPLMV